MRSIGPAGSHAATATRQVRRLFADEQGNTVAIIAAAIFPMLAVIGGGLDLARAHIVKSRLNEACDAAALAGRRSMSNEDVASAKPEANKFFEHNFAQGYLGSSTFTPDITRPDVGVIEVAAKTTVPTTLMKIFGYTTIPVAVTCNATQNFDNIDIVLVLDTTGSMAQNTSGATVGDSSSSSKMYALRQAVMALYDELKPAQDQLAAQGLRLRYGIVPYSSTVNVGNNIRAANPNYMLSTNYTYQSRVRNGGNWQYKPVSYDLASYYAGTLKTPTGSNGANVTMNWGGCIEERATISTITSSTSAANVPSGAYDLDVDLIPANDATKWKPYMASSYASGYVSPVYTRTSSSNGSVPQMACPQAARNLAVMTRSEMLNYTNSLYSDGGTYHDIGMNWGNRFISSGGIFGPNNPTTLGTRPVRKFIIFMTDGILDTGPLYSAYGLEPLDQRVTGSSSSPNQTDRHKQRFMIACNDAKKKGVSVWSIVFASASETTLSACASNSDQYAISANSTALIAKFKEIGKNIGTLRLSK